MKLDKLDIQRIYDNQPAYLRLYNINDSTEDEKKYLAYLPMFVNKLFISTKDKDVMHKIKLQYPNELHYVEESDGTMKFLGKRNTMVVDIDITTKCNLTCSNCSRFSNLKDTWTKMSLLDVATFIADNMVYGKTLTVKVIGGEPTIHPEIDRIIMMLNEYYHVILVTNGVKDYTPPVDICIEDSAKWVGINPEFHATCDAPCDDPKFDTEDYSFGCDNAKSCGSVYTNAGYYPCTIAGSIDRMLNLPDGPRKNYLGTRSLEEGLTQANQANVFNELCKYCGFYKRMGFKEAYNPDFERTTEQYYSKSWEFMNGTK